MDYIGEGYLRLSFVSEDGRYIGTSDDEIKEYYVAAQSLPFLREPSISLFFQQIPDHAHLLRDLFRFPH